MTKKINEGQRLDRDWLETKYPDLYPVIRLMSERIGGLNNRVLELEKESFQKRIPKPACVAELEIRE